MKHNTFDCVEMKHKIQQEIRAKTKGLSVEEKRRWTEKQILSDPLLSRIWKQAPKVKSSEHDIVPK